MTKARVATVWMDGCSGCHMSFLDMDERILEIAPLLDLVYSPLVDFKEFPEDVDVTIVEGAVSSTEDLEKLRMIRQRTKILVSLGDCAVTSNVPGMRNPFTVKEIMERAYIENAQNNQSLPDQVIPPLLPRSQPLHQYVKVDVFVPGCPPNADAIFYAVSELLHGRMPDIAKFPRFG